MKKRSSGLEAAVLLSPVAVLVLTLASPTFFSGAEAPRAGHTSTALVGNNVLRNDAAAMRLLQRAADAPATTAYHGVQFVTAWTEQGATGLVVEVNHRAGVGTSVHSEGTAQAAAADSYIPARGGEPSLIAAVGGLGLLAKNFDLSLASGRSVAGRAAQVIEVRRPHAQTLAARFWLDRETGLVLRREIYDEVGRTTRASAFVDVEIGRASGEVKRSTPVARAWSHQIAVSAFPKMRAAGWHCPEELASTLSLVDARRGGSPGSPILHLSFSDGLSTVSLFEQRGQLDTDKLEGYRAVRHRGGTVYVRDGVPARRTWSADGMVFTVVADASSQTVDRVQQALPAPGRETGKWARLGRGMDRVASWFNPFG